MTSRTTKQFCQTHESIYTTYIKPTTVKRCYQKSCSLCPPPNAFRLLTTTFTQSSYSKSTIKSKYITNLTFKLHNFSILGFRKPFQTNFSGEGQSNTTASQQKANLLTTSILREEGVKKSFLFKDDISQLSPYQHPRFGNALVTGW